MAHTQARRIFIFFFKFGDLVHELYYKLIDLHQRSKSWQIKKKSMKLQIFSNHFYGLLGQNVFSIFCFEVLSLVIQPSTTSKVTCRSCCYQLHICLQKSINKCKENKNECKIKCYYEPENKCMRITSQIFITIFKPQMCSMMRLWSTKMCIQLFIVKRFVDYNCWRSQVPGQSLCAKCPTILPHHLSYKGFFLLLTVAPRPRMARSSTR